jgi:glycosyltransferase involved in cell wall biosynthesis
MKILFVHQNFPGQYKHLAPALAARPDCEVVALMLGKNPPVVPGVRVLPYQAARGNSPDVHPWMLDFESQILRGEAAARAAAALHREGFAPDVICAHPAWGEALFLKDLWPRAKLLCLWEFYYRACGADLGFDPEFPSSSWEDAARARAKNAGNLLSLEAADWGLSPTVWQREQFPAWVRPRISVIHEGIATHEVRPNPAAGLRLEQAKVEVKPGDEIVTFVNRNLEPYRGYHSFMRALPEILRCRPRARALIVGGDDVSYGARPPAGQTWKQRYLDEVKDSLDLSRVHFLGKIPYHFFVALLQVSAVHVYLTYPFVLSWSMLEAMSAGCLVVGSRTPPVQEVIAHNENGLLVDFFQPGQIAATVSEALAEPARFQALRAEARRTVVERYDLNTVCLPRRIALVEAVATGLMS